MKIKKIVLVTIILLSLFSCQGKNKEHKKTGREIALLVNTNLNRKNAKNMDTIYKQQHKHLTLLVTRTADSVSIDWQIILVDKNKNELILDSIHKKRGPMWQKIEKDYGYTSLGNYTISTSYLDGTNLFIIYHNSGKVCISKYIFDKKGAFKKETKFIQNHFQTPYIAENEVVSTMLLIENELYINIEAKLSRLGTEQALYKTDLSSFSIKKITFNKDYKIAKIYQLSKSGKSRYTQNKRNIEDYNAMSDAQKEKNKSFAPTDRDIAYVKNVENYLDKSYYYKEMSVNRDEYNKETAYFYNSFGLKPHRLFSQIESNKESLYPIDKNKIKNAKTYLKEVLDLFGEKKTTERLKLLGYIYQSKADYKIFFFYKEKSLSTKIVLYDNHLNQWHIGGYTEEEIIQEQIKTDLKLKIGG